jgi:ribonuclease BN (tRNA processing enzyme)
LEGLIEGQMNPNFSPLYSIKNLGATIRFLEVDECECFETAGLSVTVKAIPHGHTNSTAFRFAENGKSIIYASDVGYPSKGIPDELIEFYRGADVLIHDCTYTPEEQAERRWRGYSSVDDAVSAAVKASVKCLALFHYDQDYTDEQVDALADRARRLLADKGADHIRVVAASENLSIEV